MEKISSTDSPVGLAELDAHKLIQHNVDGMVIVDRDGQIKFLNPAAETMFARPAAKLLNHPIGFPIVSGRSTELEINSTVGRSTVVEARVIDVQWRGQTFYLASLRDVTERKQLLERCEKLLQEAREINRLKDEFLATLSHELRTPMTAIVGWLRMIQSGRLDAQTLARAIEVIDRNVKSQVRLIEDLLDVSAIITGKMRVVKTDLDLGVLLHGSVDACRPTFTAKGVNVVYRPPASPVYLNGDPDRLRQVMTNLLVNGTKFTPSGGSITITCQAIDGMAIVAFADTGEGISPDFLPYVFDRLRQADGSSTRIHGGLGLGLSIARSLVELHGGCIHVESAGKGQGAMFVVKLPIASAQTTTVLK